MSVPSPCINVCKMDEDSGLCLGCFRTLDEIAVWGSCTDKERLAILASLAKRRQEYAPREDYLRRNCNDGDL